MGGRGEGRGEGEWEEQLRIGGGETQTGDQGLSVISCSKCIDKLVGHWALGA